MSERRQNIGSGAVWEEHVKYSRAVRVGPHVFVSGTTCAGADAYAQAKGAIQLIGRALEEAGAALKDVVRTRMFVTDIGDWQHVARAHAEAFADVRPASSMLEVRALIAPELKVEIEADAYVKGRRVAVEYKP